VPLFGFANAGVPLAGATLATLAEPLVLGIALGLFIGKQLGIFTAIWGADRLGIARAPVGVSWLQLYGMTLIAGIGFTMSLFIGGLAFDDPALIERVKIGVLAGSVASALAGIAVLLAAGKKRAS
jgi:NhaA family Na+:H+ antiporter